MAVGRAWCHFLLQGAKFVALRPPAVFLLAGLMILSSNANGSLDETSFRSAVDQPNSTPRELQALSGEQWVRTPFGIFRSGGWWRDVRYHGNWLLTTNGERLIGRVIGFEDELVIIERQFAQPSASVSTSARRVTQPGLSDRLSRMPLSALHAAVEWAEYPTIAALSGPSPFQGTDAAASKPPAQFHQLQSLQVTEDTCYALSTELTEGSRVAGLLEDWTSQKMTLRAAGSEAVQSTSEPFVFLPDTRLAVVADQSDRERTLGFSNGEVVVGAEVRVDELGETIQFRRGDRWRSRLLVELAFVRVDRARMGAAENRCSVSITVPFDVPASAAPGSLDKGHASADILRPHPLSARQAVRVTMHSPLVREVVCAIQLITPSVTGEEIYAALYGSSGPLSRVSFSQDSPLVVLSGRSPELLIRLETADGRPVRTAEAWAIIGD